MRMLCLGAILFVLPTGCTKPGSSSVGATANVNALHGDVIAALKARHWSEPGAFETCVLEPATIVNDEPTAWNVLRSRLPGLERETYDRFWSENERARPIAPLDRDAMKLHLLTATESSELEAIRNDDARMGEFWNTFRARYGDGVRVGLSAPGFSRDRQQALIYYMARFDWLGGWGAYCLLKRKGDHWEIAEEHCVWES